MNYAVKLFVIGLLCTEALFAQKSAAPEQFQLGGVLEPLGKLPIKTAEISAYMPAKKMLFVVGGEKFLEQVDLSDPSNPRKVGEFPVPGNASSVTVHGNLLAVSVLSEPEWKLGHVQLMRFDDSLEVVEQYKDVCTQPDMITFTPDGKTLLTACEGSPSNYFEANPIGAVGFISNASGKPEDWKNAKVTVTEFTGKNAKDIEPEYIAVSKDSKTAWVSLQENNAIAKVDVKAKKIKNTFSLGEVDHSKPGFGLDRVKDGKINIVNENIWSLRQPDGIATFADKGKNYVITANEGEELTTFESDHPVIFGSRSISLFNGDTGELLWDSGDAFEQMIAKLAPEYFNWNSKKGKKKMDARSDAKGCEPENVTVGVVNGRRYAFVGLERQSGIAVFDFTDVNAPKLVDYILDTSDRGPEGVLFIDAADSPIPGQALLIVGYEYSKNLTVYKVK
ncbi:MAG: alkaline phosphatase [Fibrobacter sp.]|nr:alkaline phosphatase [Fibrobacter sp.]